jgi:hypothetical protein
MDIDKLIDTTKLDPQLQKQIDYGSSGTDVMHGYLKNQIHEANIQYELAVEAEEASGEAMDSMERKYWEGVLEAYHEIYQLTYALAFAIQERTKARG